jgi:hypothetical protein
MENFQKWDPKRTVLKVGAITGNGNAISSGLEGFRQIGSFIVVCEQLIVCVQYVDIMSNCRRHV